MPALALHKNDRVGLSILREMPEAALSSFLLAIEKASHAIPDIPGIASASVAQAKEVLDTMYGIRAYHEVPLEQFVDDICESLREHKELEPSDEAAFRERLTRLLAVTALSVAAKAAILQQEHERNFCSIRIITDARPVYANGASGSPSAMLITHTMKLSYHEGAGGPINDIYLSFGTEDIEEIRAAFVRAEEKAKSLRDVFTGAQIKFIGYQE